MPSLQNDAGNAGMAYNFAQRLIGEGMSAGEALNALRRDVTTQNRWWYWKNYLKVRTSVSFPTAAVNASAKNLSLSLLSSRHTVGRNSHLKFAERRVWKKPH